LGIPHPKGGLEIVIKLDTLKLKASGEWLEAGERIVCRVSGCFLECLGPRVNEESVFGFDAVVVETTTLVEDQDYGLYQVGSSWPLGLADVQKMVAKHPAAHYSRGGP